MKKGLSLAALAAVSISAVAVAPATSVDAAANEAQKGFYDTVAEKYYTVAEFQALTSAQKVALIQKSGFYLHTGTHVISGKDAALSTNAQLANKLVAKADFTAADLDAIYAGTVDPAPVDPAPAGELKVESVSAINAEELLVTFGTEVSSSALEKKNYEISVNGDKIAGTTSIKDIELDGKTAILRLKDIDSGTGGDQFQLRAGDKIVVQTSEAITSADGQKFPRYASPEFVYDVTAKPALKNVALNNATNELALTFDRPVNTSTTLIKVDGIDINTATLTAVNANDAGNYSYTVSVAGVTADQLKSFKETGTHEVVLFDVADTAAANPVVSSVINGSYTISEDTEAPKVVGVEAVNSHKFFIETNKTVTLEDGYTNLEVYKGNHKFTTTTVEGGSPTADSTVYADVATRNGKPGIYVVVAEDSNIPGDDLNPLYRDGESSVNLDIVLENYTANDLIGAKYTGSVTVSKDTRKPEIESTELNESADALYVTFAGELTAAPKAADIIVRDKDQVVIGGIQDGDITLSAADTVKIDLNGIHDVKADKAPYSVEFKPGKLTYALDETSVANYVVKSLSNDKLIAEISPSATGFKYIPFSELGGASVSESNNVITIDYAVEMTDSARDKSNYQLDGKALPAGATVDFVGDKTTVAITLPEGTVRTTTDYKLTISTDVTTKNGERVVKDLQSKAPYEETEELTDNVKPSLVDAKYVVTSNDAKTSDKIKLKFSEDLASLTANNVIDNLEVVINGTKQEITVDATEATNTDEFLVITLAKPVSLTQATNITVVKDAAGNVDIKDASTNDALVGSKAIATEKELDTAAIADNALFEASQVTSVTASDLTGAANDGKVSVSWDALANATSYKVTYTPAGGTPTTKTVTGATTTTLDALTAGTVYTISVVGNNGSVDSTAGTDTVTPADYVAATPATLTSTVTYTDDTAASAAQGKTVTVAVDGALAQTVDLTTITTKTQLIAAFDALTGVTATWDGNAIKLVSETTGTSSSLTVSGTDAASVFGTATSDLGSNAAN